MTRNKKINKTHYKLLNFIVLLILFCVITWGVIKYFHIGDSNYTNAAQIEAYVNPINTRVSGYVEDIHFTDHQKVKKGDTLIIINDNEILTQVAQAEASYYNALAAKETTISSIKTIENNLNVANSTIAGAKVRMWNAEQNFNRYKNLLEDEAVTRQQFDQARTEYEAQKATYERLQKQKTTTVLSVKEAKTKIAANEAEIKKAKAVLDMAKINLSYTVITAPYDGTVGRRTINEGQLLQAGQQLVFLVETDNMWVTANYLEKQMEGIQIGQKLNVAIDALGGKILEGKVIAISAATGAKYAAIPVDNSSGNFVKVQQRIPVKIEFTKNNIKEDLEQLIAGMNVVLTIK